MALIRSMIRRASSLLMSPSRTPATRQATQAGFRADELNIEVKENLLTVQGRKAANDEPQRRFLHRGLAERDFERRFQLADYVVVTEAKLADGLLSVSLKRELPEALKPRRIEIATTAASTAPVIEGEKAA